MSINTVAARLVELCKMGQFEAAQKELYADNATSIEPADSPGLQTVTGMDKIIEKGHQFQSQVEAVHGITVSDPLIAGEFFSIMMDMDITMKGMGRMKMDEIAVYHVQDGKVISEQFFYHAM